MGEPDELLGRSRNRPSWGREKGEIGFWWRQESYEQGSFKDTRGGEKGRGD